MTGVCVHADEWAFAVTRGDPDRELEALEVGCLLASTRAAHGYFAVPERLPDGARFLAPPLPVSLRRGRLVHRVLSGSLSREAGRDDRAG